jgi:hypothetical protein
MDISKASQKTQGWWTQLKIHKDAFHVKHSKYFKIPKDMASFYVEMFKREIEKIPEVQSHTLENKILVWFYTPNFTNHCRKINQTWGLVCAKNRAEVSQNKIKKYQQKLWS